jgi:flagellar biosynthesis/type III secretory pathway M-ring protein FliF/YscJ
VIERLKATKGQVRRVSAAVVLNHKQMQNPSDVQLSGKKVPFTPEELQKINELVKDAIGFVKERGDTVSVVNMPFSEEPVMESNVMTPDVVSQLLRYGAIALGVLFAYFAILRPLLKPATLKVAPTEPAMVVSEPSAPPAPSAAELMRQQMQAQQEAWELEREMQSAQREHQVRAAQQAAQEQREREMASKQKYDELVEYASQYAREHANETALLLRAWLSDSHAPAKTDVNGDHA